MIAPTMTPATSSVESRKPRAIAEGSETGLPESVPTGLREPGSIQSLAETPEPRGESGFVGCPVFGIAFVARAVGHAFDTRDVAGGSNDPCGPQSRADHTEGVLVSQEMRAHRAKRKNNCCLSRLAKKRGDRNGAFCRDFRPVRCAGETLVGGFSRYTLAPKLKFATKPFEAAARVPRIVRQEIAIMRMALDRTCRRHSIALAAVSAQAQNGRPRPRTAVTASTGSTMAICGSISAPARFRCAAAARSAGPAIPFPTSARRWKARSRDCRATMPR